MKKNLWKKLLSLGLSVSLLASLLAGCGGGTSGSTGDGEIQEIDMDGDPYHITMAYIGEDQDDLSKVAAAISELSEKEINMTFDVVPLGWGEYQEKLNLALTSGGDYDIVPVIYELAGSYVNQNQIVDLSELIYDYGQDIIDFMGEDVATSASINGYLYGIPANKESASAAGVVMRKDVCDEIGVKAEDVKTYADLTDVFEKVKKAYPDMDCITGTNIIQTVEIHDSLFDEFGVIMIPPNEPVVTNYFESDWYKDKVGLVSQWYQKGYVRADAATSSESSQLLVKNKALFSYMSSIKPGFLVQENVQCGTEMVTAYIGLDDGTEVNNLFTTGVNYIDWGISSLSDDPVKAMQFLNWTYNSAEFNNLLIWGIEGEHYEVEDGLAVWPEGLSETNNTYHLNLGWELPNQFLAYPWEGNDKDIWDQYQEFNDSGNKSVAFGFIYDSSGVTTELSACQNVRNEYYKALETGSAGAKWEEKLEEYNKKLYSAGLQKLMDTKQEQLDEWLANKE